MPEHEAGYYQMTQAEYDKLETKHSEMLTVKAKEIADALKEARSYGDLSENAEYDAAKENEAKFHQELNIIEDKLNNAEIVDVDADQVGLGVTVTVKEKGNKKEQKFEIVGVDVDPFADPPKISVSSPIGNSLNGKSLGDIVEVQAPNGVRQFEIKNIEKTTKEEA